MIKFNPAERFTLSQVMNHPWLQEDPTATLQEAQALFTSRGLKILEVPQIIVPPVELPQQNSDSNVPEEEEKKQDAIQQTRRVVFHRSGDARSAEEEETYK